MINIEHKFYQRLLLSFFLLKKYVVQRQLTSGRQALDDSGFVSFHFKRLFFLGIPSSADSVPMAPGRGQSPYAAAGHMKVEPVGLRSTEVSEAPAPWAPLFQLLGKQLLAMVLKDTFRDPLTTFSLLSISLGCRLAYRSWGQPRSGLWSVPAVKPHNSSLESFAQLRKILSQVGN